MQSSYCNIIFYSLNLCNIRNTITLYRFFLYFSMNVIFILEQCSLIIILSYYRRYVLHTKEKWVKKFVNTRYKLFCLLDCRKVLASMWSINCIMKIANYVVIVVRHATAYTMIFFAKFFLFSSFMSLYKIHQ